MNPLTVFAAYALAAAVALGLLYYLGVKPWYFHVLSVTAAFAIGLWPMNPQWASPAFDVCVGSMFTFLLFWGAAAPFFVSEHHHYHGRHHHGHA